MRRLPFLMISVLPLAMSVAASPTFCAAQAVSPGSPGASIAPAPTTAPQPSASAANQNAAATPATADARQQRAQQFIQDLGNKAVSVMADKSLTQTQRSDKYGQILHDAFDIPVIARFVLGRSWATATPDQQQRFMKLFEALTVKIYGDRLNFYSGEGFAAKNARPENDKELTVSSAITHPSGDAPTPIDWRVKDDGGKLAVVDVSVAGVSQSLTQRQEYAAIIQRNNGNIDGLLDLMQQRLNGQPASSP